ncbi:unnamed protein product [Sphagnum jensenii]
MSGNGFQNVPFTGNNGVGNEFVNALLNNENFVRNLEKRLGPLAKADTIQQATNLLWYDLRPVVQMLYPYRELIPRISRLPRVAADGGNAFHWKRITGVNINGASSGVSEGNRGARIAIAEQDLTAAYKTLGFESSVTFEARLGAKNLSPEALGISVQSALRSLMIDEEKILINGNATISLGTTPTPTLVAGAVTGLTGSFSSGTVYVVCVALTGMGYLGYSPYNSATNTGGVLGQVTKVNADATTDTYGGGSAQPSAEASVATSGTQCVTATCTLVSGAFAYAWFVGSATGAEYLAGITPSNQAIFTKYPATTNQPIGNLKVGATYADNSVDQLIPDGVLAQVFGQVTGPSPGQYMSTNPLLPSGISFTQGGSIVYSMAAGNTGLTLAGSNFNEIDAVLRAAYDQYKIGYDRILISATDVLNTFGAMLGQASTANGFRLWFDADQETGRIIAGRRVTSYLNKFFNNTLDVEVHPYVPPGCILFWSDRSPYELSGVANLLEAHVRQDYYQIQWPWRSRRYEYGVYCDETFPCYFTPAFGAIINLNPTTGSFSF